MVKLLPKPFLCVGARNTPGGCDHAYKQRGESALHTSNVAVISVPARLRDGACGKQSYLRMPLSALGYSKNCHVGPVHSQSLVEDIFSFSSFI
jgi:hypothetical protein